MFRFVYNRFVCEPNGVWVYFVCFTSFYYKIRILEIG